MATPKHPRDPRDDKRDEAVEPARKVEPEKSSGPQTGEVSDEPRKSE